MPNDFWVLFFANLPFLAAVFYALQKKWIIMGVTFTREMENKDKEIAFREQLRQEALIDKATLEKTSRELASSMGELTTVVKQTLELNERLLNEMLDQRWDGYDRRAPKTPTRTR